MSFEIDFANPRAGWLEVRFAYGDDPIIFAVSAILNDPVRELAELGVFVATGEYGRAAVRFWLEPDWYELAVTRADHWELVLRHDDELVGSVVIDAPRAIASEILRCLRALQPQISVDGDGERWPHPFPAAQVARLVESLRT